MAVYRFRYDARGKSLIIAETPIAPAPQPSPIAPALAPASPADIAATPTTQSPLSPEWESVKRTVKIWDPVQIVIDLKEWLEDHPDFGLEMDLLEEREILKTPPHWSYVSDDIEVHRSSHGSSPGWQEQSRAATQYASMLLDRQAEVEKAVELAAFASVASDNPESDGRMRDALRALPKGGKVDKTIFSELPQPATPFPLMEADVKKWADALLQRYEEIAKQPDKAPDWAAIETANWVTWERRFRGYRKRPRQRPFEVDSADLLLRTRNAGPAVLFRNKLAAMTLREWSNALFISMRHTLPPPSVVTVPSWVRGQIETQLLRDRKSLLVILGDSVTSPSAEWLPSKSNGCLWIAKEQWNGGYYAMFRDIRQDAKDWIFVVELAGDPRMLAVAANQLPVLSTPVNVLGTVTKAYMAKDKLPPEVTPAVPFVDDPKSVDDLFSRIEALTVRSQSAS
jgi:hypothetical protein